MKWQPIETAPRDGTPILAWSEMYGGKVVMANWRMDSYAVRPKPYWSFNDERTYGTRMVRMCQPTHWMPLPEGPEAAPQ